MKHCQFQEFGCQFKHEFSPECFIRETCKNKCFLFQNKRKFNTSSQVNKQEPTEKHNNDLKEAELNNNINVNFYENNADNMFCSKYCSNDDMVC